MQKRLIVATLIGLFLLAGAQAGRSASASGGEAVVSSGPHTTFEATFPCFGGIYPRLAALSDSWSECGIGAVVPWANRLWYISYVAHKAGAGVGLYEIDRHLRIQKRPESVVGTHAGRLIHRESNQLFIGPYAIDHRGNVRVIAGLVGERVTAFARHLKDPSRLVYAQAMEGKLYEVEVHNLQCRVLFDLSREALGINGRSHFKGAYTSQGRLVVANNTYESGDVARGFGSGRLAEWDGDKWRVIRQTAYCDVTTAHGVEAIAEDAGPLWAVGWDRASVILSVLAGGQWRHYRLLKGSESHDHAWCTEWPRIRRITPQHWMVDMHGMFWRMEEGFGEKHLRLEPLAGHLRIVPDFCRWGEHLVLAGNQNSSMGHRHRAGGQPQSNLWFGTVEQLENWGEPSGWGGPWCRDLVKPGEPSEPLLVGGYRHRTLFVFPTKEISEFYRCADRFPVVECPSLLRGMWRVSVRRGSMERPGTPFRFSVNRPVVVYLSVHDRGQPVLPSRWQPTEMTLTWEHDQIYTDKIHHAEFPAGEVEIPEHSGRNDRGHYGVPHLCFVQPLDPEGIPLEISPISENLGVVVETPGELDRGDQLVNVRVEIDPDGSGGWKEVNRLQVGPQRMACWMIPDEMPAIWLRLIADRPARLTAQLCCGRAYASYRRNDTLLSAFAPVKESVAGNATCFVPLADRLWCLVTHVAVDGSISPAGFFQVDSQLRIAEGFSAPDKAGAIPPGLNRQMVGSSLSIGPYCVSERGEVKLVEGLCGHPIVATIRDPSAPERRMFLLTITGLLQHVELRESCVVAVFDLKQELGLGGQELCFRAGHQVGSSLIIAGMNPNGTAGILAEKTPGGWRIVDRAAYAEVCNLGSMSETVVAVGWDATSALLKVRDLGGRWSTIRLPKASAHYDRCWAKYLPRLREVETERLLLDTHGIFYEVSGLPYAWSIQPICTHGRLISDFGSWRGLLVLSGPAVLPAVGPRILRDGNLCLWLGKTDDLWQLPKPTGKGGPWLASRVKGGVPSDPFLMYGFENKRLELSHLESEPIRFRIDVDPTTTRQAWQSFTTVEVPPGESVSFEFPSSFSAHWVRLEADRDCMATAQFHYW